MSTTYTHKTPAMELKTLLNALLILPALYLAAASFLFIGIITRQIDPASTDLLSNSVRFLINLFI